MSISISLNPEKCGGVSNFKSLLNCPSCHKEKTKEDFHILEYKILNKVIKSNYLIDLPCKECVSVDYIYWSKDKGRPSVDFNKLRENYLNNKIKEYENKNNINLINKTTALEILGLNYKSYLQKYTKLGVIQCIKFLIPTFLYSKGDDTKESLERNFYIKSEIELFKFHRENGHYYHPNKIYQKYYTPETLKPTPPYIFIGYNNKPIFFVNMKEGKKPCGKCLKIKNLDEFYPDKQMKCRRKTSCKECDKVTNLKRYNNFNRQEKLKHLKQVSDWKKQNKEKVKAYKNTPENKIIRNLRRRVKDVVGDIINLNKNKPIKYSSMKNLGCSRAEFKIYIESLFQEGMTWENYGPGYKTNNKGLPIYDKMGNIILLKQWNIDHILPVSKFDLNDPEAIKKINYFKNLRPAWTEDNIIKSNKILGELINNPEIQEIYEKYIKLCDPQNTVQNAI